MKKLITQLDFVRAEILKNGKISRNFCLQNFITRLGSRIYDLRKEGFDFEIERQGGDYVYKAVRTPDQPENISSYRPFIAQNQAKLLKTGKLTQDRLFTPNLMPY